MRERPFQAFRMLKQWYRQVNSVALLELNDEYARAGIHPGNGSHEGADMPHFGSETFAQLIMRVEKHV